MARLAIIGFETGDANEGTGGLVGTSSIQSTIKRTGTYALRCNPATTGTGYLTFRAQTGATWATAAIGLSDVYARFYLYVATAPSDYENTATLTDGSGIGLRLRIKSSGGGFICRLLDGSGNTSDGSTVFSLSTFHRIEMRLKTSATTASELVVNGAAEITTTGSGYTGTVQTLILGKNVNTNGNTVDFYYDDVAIDDAAYPGASSIVLLYPNAAGTDQTWTPSTGTDHFAVVDDWNSQAGDDGDSTYVSVSLSGTQAEENNVLNYTGNFPAASSIPAVLGIVIVRNASGSANVGTARFRSGTTNSDQSPAADPGASYVVKLRLFATDPADSAAWTESKVGAVQIGFVKTQSQARAMRMTASGVMVEYVPAVTDDQSWLPRSYTAEPNRRIVQTIAY